METGVLRLLIGAIEDLEAAKAATGDGDVMDLCDDAMMHIQNAMFLIIGAEEE